MTIKITTNNLAPRARYPLYKIYPGQIQAQPAYLALDCENEEISVDYRRERGAPACVWENRTLRFPIPNRMSRKGLRALLSSVPPLAEKIVDGFENRNGRGYFDQGAYAAIADLEYICQRQFCDYDNVKWI